MQLLFAVLGGALAVIAMFESRHHRRKVAIPPVRRSPPARTATNPNRLSAYYRINLN
jgi:hypothetical protein